MLATKSRTDSIMLDFYESCFDLKIYEVKEKGIEGRDVELLARQREGVIRKALAMDLPKQKNPFLPVWPFSYFSINQQFKLIKDPRGDSKSEIDLNLLQDEIKAFNVPYFLIGIEEGFDTIGEKFYSSIQNINYHNRTPLTLSEIFSIAINTDTFESINLWAVGSKCGPKSYPLLKTNSIGPVISVVASRPTITLKHAGIPSCVERACFI